MINCTHKARLRFLVVVLFSLSTTACTMTISSSPVAPPNHVVTPIIAAVESLPVAEVTAAVNTSLGIPPIASVATSTPIISQEAASPAAVLQMAVTLALPTETPVATPEPTAIPEPPSRLFIPVIGLDAPVSPLGWSLSTVGEQAISAWESLPVGAAGWHTNSAVPGEGSNVVISGHHNIAGEVFRHLVDLKPGDEIIVEYAGRDYYYHVSEKLILPEKYTSPEQRLQNATWILPTHEERLTLVTCWPYENNTHRLVLVALPENEYESKVAQR